MFYLKNYLSTKILDYSSLNTFAGFNFATCIAIKLLKLPKLIIIGTFKNKGKEVIE